MPVHNVEIITIFNGLADLLDIQEADRFRIRAYRNAADMIAGLPDSLSTVVKDGKDLSALPTIGKNLAAKITEIVSTGISLCWINLSKLRQPILPA